MHILQWSYIAVGLLTLTAISVFTITQCLQWAFDIIDRIRRPWHKLYYIQLFKDLSQAFYVDKKIQHIFDELCQRGLTGRGFDVWAFRDQIEKDFPKEALNPSSS